MSDKVEKTELELALDTNVKQEKYEDLTDNYAVSVEDGEVSSVGDDSTMLVSNLELLNSEKFSELVDISVEIREGVVVDGDKDSEENIKTALLVLEEDEKTHWLTVGNEVIEVSRDDLKKALRLIGEEKREIIFKYRKLKDELI